MTGPLFSAFCRNSDLPAGPAVGFTVPRALGGAVIRNRIKRRMRESVRLRLALLPRGWQVVFNPRRSVLACGFEELGREVERVFERCAGRS